MSSRVLRQLFAADITYYDYTYNRQAVQPILDQYWKENQNWIEEEGGKFGYAWVIVCGREIVVGGYDMHDFQHQTEKLDAVGRSRNRVAFLYALTPAPREDHPSHLPVN